jgi:hypothetical protein
MNSMRTRTSSRFCKFNIAIWLLSATVWILFVGCEEAYYKGGVVKASVDRVVIFDVKGTDGEIITKQLGTEMNSLGKAVLYGNQYGEPTDSIAASKIARDLEAHTYIMGEITVNSVIKDKLEIHGTFTLHDADSGDQIGGITDAYCSEDTDVLSDLWGIPVGTFDLLERTLGNKTQPNEQKYAKEMAERVESQRAAVYKKFVHKVAMELNVGLGGKRYNTE